jgi:hypothetical protein
VTVRRVEDVSSGHDVLAEALHTRAGWRPDRSRAVVSWRFAKRPGFEYRIHEAVDRRGASQGFCVVRVIGERAVVADLQLLDESSGLLADLLRSATEGLGAGVTNVAVRCPQTGWLTRRLVSELGFAPEESDCHLEVRPLAPSFDLERAAPLFDYRYADHEIF